jgi:hypothetical protein
MPSRQKWLAVGTFKRSHLVDLGTLKSLNKYLFKKRKKLYFKERCPENIYAVDNVDCKLEA